PPPAAARESDVVSLGSSRSEHVALACPGRIEGATETINIGAGISGVLAAVLVEEGRHVDAGDVIARFDCADVEAESRAEASAVDVAIESRQRLLRGSRDEERREARATIAEAESLERQAHAAYGRVAELFERKVLSTDEFERARRDNDVAKPTMRRAEEHP